jgi:hypothetical protein
MNLLSAVFCSDSVGIGEESEEITGVILKIGVRRELNMKNTSIKSVSAKLATLFFAAGLVFAAPAIAETPDGTTPANEGVCDGLKTTATPGLYGLCVAYCEAQDLDVTGKEPPNTKILENYNKRKQASDPDMPCVKIPCPCWTDAELASISVGGAAACLRSSTSTGASVQLIDNTPKTHFALADTTRMRCAYVDLNLVTPIVRSQTISPADAQACYNAVSAACTDLGL